jgi:dihydrofolate synthase/folylpolyglutamate synthase
MTGADTLNAQEAIKFIHSKQWRASKPGLERTRLLLEKMGNPERALRFVHVAGTNGKGSTSAMLSGILAAAGYKTGLYTSPYISSFNERMQVNGVPIDDAALAEITEKLAPSAQSMSDSPTEFEIVTTAAMEFFARESCEIVVLEAGMGGRLDSTNVIERPLCSVITNIGLDHTNELGDTVEKIAGEKAGIIKQSCPTLIYDLPKNVRAVFERRCEQCSSELTSADFGQIKSISDSRGGQVFSYKNYRELFLPLLGRHQLKNAALALEAVSQLRTRGFEITDEAVKSGLEQTRWPARFEIINDSPFFVLDGGHNPQCAETVSENLLRYFPGMKKIIIFGVLADKDYMGMARSLNEAADCFITITPPVPRAKSADELAADLRIFGKPVFSCETIESGVEKALSIADSGSVICAVGSLYSAGTVRKHFVK